MLRLQVAIKCARKDKETGWIQVIYPHQPRSQAIRAKQFKRENTLFANMEVLKLLIRQSSQCYFSYDFLIVVIVIVIHFLSF